MKKILIILLMLQSVVASAGRGAITDLTQTPECLAWVDSVYATLTPRQRVAQLVVGHVDPTGGETTKSVLRKMVATNKIGGILFSKGSLDQYATMINYAQSISQVPLMVTLDGEWGLAMRVPQAPHFPVNMALGAISDPDLMFDYGREVARECRELGIHVNFAPVLDVNSNPDNPVIGQRSYGDNAERVADLGAYYSLGLEDGGVMAVAKHFPGHGDTNADSHKTLPTINRTAKQLQECDLLPFNEFITSGCSGIMVAHLIVPAYDKSNTAASMSKKITTELLREQMGFDGLVFTDGLEMEGSKVKGNQCVEALKAGADVLLCPPAYATDIDAVLQAVNNGTIPQSRIEESCKRILAYKYALGLNNYTPVEPRRLRERIDNDEAARINRLLSDATPTLLRNDGEILPIGNLDNNRIAIVNIGAPADNAFVQYCRRYANVDVYSVNGNVLSEAKVQTLAGYNTVIAAVYTDKQWARQTLGQLDVCRGLVDVFLINPYKVGKFADKLPQAKALLTVHYDTPYTQQAAAKAIFGGLDVSGRMPVSVRGVGRTGQGLSLKKTRLGFESHIDAGFNPDMAVRLDSLINKALEAGAFPGCQLIVGRGGNIVIDRCYGVTTKGGRAVTPSTLYDLASVSKAVGTLPGVMSAYDNRLMQLDTPISMYIPELLEIEGKKDITPRMLLMHESGMPAGLSMYSMMMDTASYTGKLLTSRPDATHNIRIDKKLYGHDKAKLRSDILGQAQSRSFPLTVAPGIYAGSETIDSIMMRIYNTKVKPNRGYLYSDLNFCLLMDIEQRVTGEAHQDWVCRQVWAPIGAGFCYNAAAGYPLDEIAPTERDTYLRKQQIHGYVHDELAAFSGGVQGNAGVFGTATDIAKLCQTWLNGGMYGDARVFSDETTRLFTTAQSTKSRRGLGFDKPDMANPKASPTTPLANASVYGHLGFTGTVFWVDPSNDMFMVFLCNRVNPTRDNTSFSSINPRPELMRIIYESL